jgi:4-amino-4-deoxy-L-arabinose transferase-like glycosyltransferase
VPLLIILGFVLLAFAYSMRVPPFETPDEVNHFAFARNIAQGKGLPVQAATPTGPWEHEGSQPPLYYLITGGLTSWIDQSDFATLATRNPHANIGNPLYPGNKNFMLYSGVDHPLRDSNLALHIGRWFSILLGALSLWLVLGTARLAFGPNDPRALLAMGMAAAIPQFAFIHAAFSNDALITFLSVATIFSLAQLLAAPDEKAFSWRRWLLLGVLLGAAALSKLQGLGLSLMAGLVVPWLAWRRRDRGIIWRAAPWLALPILLIAGWWFVRNLLLYGDITGTTLLLTLNGLRTAERSLADWWLEFRGLRYSFWGIFGWFNILLPQWYYSLMDALALVAMGGAGAALVRRWRIGRSAPRDSAMQDSSTRVMVLLLGWALLVAVLLFSFTAQATASQGRLLFPAISAITVLGVLGMDFWLRLLPRPAAPLFWTLLLTLLVGLSLYTLAVLLPRAYRPVAAVNAPPATAQPLDVRYSGATPLTLVGVEAPARAAAGLPIPVTLYLSAPITPTSNATLFVQLLDESSDAIANVTTHPGWGRNPTTRWRAGAIYPDAYTLELTRSLDNRSPLAARLYVGFVDPATADQGNRPLPATNGAGEAVTPIVATIVLAPSEPPTLESLGLPVHGATFGDVIRVDGAALPNQSPRPSDSITATLLYGAMGQPATDYTAFVHLLDGEGNQVAGHDQAPAAGRLSTSLWRSGDKIAATFPLALPADLPPGLYTVVTGLYESGSGGALRLPVSDAAGHAAGDGWVEIGQIVVE